MKEKIAYLSGLIDGMDITDDNNGRIIRSIVDCLYAIAEEIETNSYRLDNIEESITDAEDRLDDIDQLIDIMCDEDMGCCDCDCEPGNEDWEDSFDFFTCPDCGEIVMLDEDMVKDNKNPICPKCNKPLFNHD